MLDRTTTNQYHYYQPGIGTYVTSASLSHSGFTRKIKSAYVKAKDAAVGSTLADHVMGGYKFLMRYYCPGDQIYFFGFSRGAYVARFLAEMLDKIGLLEAGNEELIRFVWKTFAKWQQCSGDTTEDKAQKEKLEEYMRAFKETFCHPVPNLRFLGLFDTVNSVPRFERAWMSHNRFPYTARTSAKVIRHAVSIDERRAKFRQDLISEVKPTGREHRFRLREHLEKHHVHLPHHTHHQRHNGRLPDSAQQPSPVASSASSESEKTDNVQDIEEVWFPGCHTDIGGGWPLRPGEYALSHVPLVWMVHNAQKAGLRFEPEKLRRFVCSSDAAGDHAEHSQGGNTPGTMNNGAAQNEQEGDDGKQSPASDFECFLHKSSTDSRMHDALRFGKGVRWTTVLSWKVMEYLPFRRMDLQEDGSWKPIRWPLPCGEVRDIPDDAKIHVSAIRRLKSDPEYRPGNLIMGGGGRGKKKAPKECGIGEWQMAEYPGCPIKETYVRKPLSKEAHHMDH
ncbi:hypothetical protein CNMCM6936_005056 [Aspergillus lentulus]|uniref:T6SS Phospholipase effector Tle1-like catalytic domain-containing protein n=1 Tax=Aspergillus lentulus TaxID=293939 RepID=A0AAN5YRR5_ASPLE|nr:hypothetical protein CNMCM6936_005056 [Aspergillus lentulus]KAF4206111.1 hypothetical protein CNMCM8927_005360 [Aspergillus lentulus]GFF64725.1 hypothetical protein IFM62136_06053 [Aspergillus lentulus]GFF87205.1 hypothetical protein IFM47457_07415 [Aspergillus lentulus]GFG11927.1 hypothetical protein IFM61392_07150 [Aspergillus lentulus]